ncbi:MAG: DUF1223 domain-containing protein [Sphingomonadaceae bacterium]|nr:DUF1223 domain-containing protein [Sphingomonadaceae bacterium]
MFRSVLLGAALGAAAAAHAADARHPTVIELYQSQGCSSCPPAIANLNALADRPDVLTLTFAVTYWDDLGWKDTFASPAQTARQWDYARGFGHDQVWTPQVIVDGRGDVVGARAGQIEGLLAKTPARSGPAIDLQGRTVVIGSGAAPAGGADVWLVRYDPRTISVAVRAGENSGRRIDHRNVVRELVRIGRWTGSSATLPLPADAPGLKTAVLVQKTGGPILAAVRG